MSITYALSVNGKKGRYPDLACVITSLPVRS